MQSTTLSQLCSLVQGSVSPVHPRRHHIRLDRYDRHVVPIAQTGCADQAQTGMDITRRTNGESLSQDHHAGLPPPASQHLGTTTSSKQYTARSPLAAVNVRCAMPIPSATCRNHTWRSENSHKLLSAFLHADRCGMGVAQRGSKSQSPKTVD